jgi:hypothetical protein
MNQIDDLGHCGLLSAFSSRRMRELNALPIAQQSARQKQVVDVCRRSFEIIRLHVGREGPLSRAMGVVRALTWCLQTPSVAGVTAEPNGTAPTSHKAHLQPFSLPQHLQLSDVYCELGFRRLYGLTEVSSIK